MNTPEGMSPAKARKFQRLAVRIVKGYLREVGSKAQARDAWDCFSEGELKSRLDGAGIKRTEYHTMCLRYIMAGEITRLSGAQS